MWYAVVNDLIGGWSVANVNRPQSELDTRDREIKVIADMIPSEKDARLIAFLLNANDRE